MFIPKHAIAIATKLKVSLHLFRRLRFNPLPEDKMLDSSKLKQIADDISKCILTLYQMTKFKTGSN